MFFVSRAERLAKLCLALNLTPVEFAAHVQLPLRRARRILKPTHKPSIGLMARVRRSFPNVSADWLLLGEGEMFLPSAAGIVVGTNYGHVVQTIHHTCSCAQLHDQLLDKERTIQILLNLPCHPLQAAA